MRQLVIDLIRRSKWYEDCITNGLQVPQLETETDQDLLELYEFTLRR